MAPQYFIFHKIKGAHGLGVANNNCINTVVDYFLGLIGTRTVHGCHQLSQLIRHLSWVEFYWEQTFSPLSDVLTCGSRQITAGTNNGSVSFLVYQFSGTAQSKYLL